MADRNEEPAASRTEVLVSDDQIGAHGLRELARRRTAWLVLVAALALLIGGLGGLILYLVLGAA